MLKGKSAIVTGSTSGIGLGIATALAEQGADVLLNGFGDGDRIDTLRHRLEQQIADQARAHGISPENVVRDVMLVHQARKEFVRIEELAALTVFLCSEAGASMTGTALPMDGGWTLH